MPWVSFNSAGVEVKPGAKAASVVLGLIVVALGFALRAAPLPGITVAVSRWVIAVMLPVLSRPLV
jgi:hypothetical protein